LLGLVTIGIYLGIELQVIKPTVNQESTHMETQDENLRVKLNGFNNRCSICDCTDSTSLSYDPMKIKPWLSFYITDDDRTVCSECSDEINENRISLEANDEDEVDFMILFEDVDEVMLTTTEPED
jgi:hypothetical protein